MRIAVIEESQQLGEAIAAWLKMDGHTVISYHAPPLSLEGFDMAIIEPGACLRWMQDVARFQRDGIHAIIFSFHEENLAACRMLHIPAIEKWHPGSFQELSSLMSQEQAILEDRP